MTENTEQHGQKRYAWLAAVLSITMPGVGHVYCGELARGLFFGLLYGVAIPIALGSLAYASPASTVTFGFLMIAAMFGVVVAAVVDTVRLARHTRPDFRPKPCNHVAVYVLIGLMIQGSSIGYALHVRSSLFEAFRVPAASQYPNIVPNDRILADKTAYRKADPQVGDVVIFRPPDANWRIYYVYVKRIVALAGETVEIKDGVLYVNDKELPRRPLGPGSTEIRNEDGSSQTIEGDIVSETNGSTTYKIFLSPGRPGAISDFAKMTVPPHHCFVLGDNRDYSLDSRHFGPVPYACIEGRVDYIYWPVDTWSRFGRLD
jgi:signal peptidase I